MNDRNRNLYEVQKVATTDPWGNPIIADLPVSFTCDMCLQEEARYRHNWGDRLLCTHCMQAWFHSDQRKKDAA